MGAVRILCPHCHAEESRCPEALPACQRRGAEMRRLYAAANGSPDAGYDQRRVVEEAVTRALRPVIAEREAWERRCSALEREVERLRAELSVPGRNGGE